MRNYLSGYYSLQMKIYYYEDEKNTPSIVSSNFGRFVTIMLAIQVCWENGGKTEVEGHVTTWGGGGGVKWAT